MFSELIVFRTHFKFLWFYIPYFKKIKLVKDKHYIFDRKKNSIDIIEKGKYRYKVIPRIHTDIKFY